MFGYVTTVKDFLSEEEQDLYRGYYCGVCKSLGVNHGQPSRFLLNYDAPFLALLMESLEEEKTKIEREHCLLHHIEKNPVVKESKWVDFAGDMMILLSYHKFLDDVEDEHPLRGRMGSLAIGKSYGRAKKKYPGIARAIEEQMKLLRELEEEKSSSLDRCSITSGEMMKSIFGFGRNGEIKTILEEIGFSLGVWIYLVDALDDYEEDLKKGSYNPLIYRKAGREGLEPLLYDRLSKISNGIDLLDMKKNKGIIENIVMMGMRAQTDRVLHKISEAKEKDEGSI